MFWKYFNRTTSQQNKPQKSHTTVKMATT